jgi:hypothetical protein
MSDYEDEDNDLDIGSDAIAYKDENGKTQVKFRDRETGEEEEYDLKAYHKRNWYGKVIWED